MMHGLRLRIDVGATGCQATAQRATGAATCSASRAPGVDAQLEAEPGGAAHQLAPELVADAVAAQVDAAQPAEQTAREQRPRPAVTDAVAGQLEVAQRHARALRGEKSGRATQAAAADEVAADAQALDAVEP